MYKTAMSSVLIKPSSQSITMHKVLIANRGEIAVRIIRACKELGIQTVAVFSTADSEQLHVKMADEAICIGKESSRESYMNIQRILAAATACGANAIHPGYGFLAENSQFAAIVRECHLIFIGPETDTLHLLGNKTHARLLARKCHIPILDGSANPIRTLEEGLAQARDIGYPIMLKAVNGGGGKGIAICLDEDSLKESFFRTLEEGSRNTGSAGVYIEKYIESARHIEIQILADKQGNIVHLGERDCSLQRKNQKVIEECPSPCMTETLRHQMGLAAIRLAKAAGYINAGTAEFLVDNNNKFFFIEMNPRIQVEHPVSEWATGIDLVKQQLLIAFDNQLPFRQGDIHVKGHTIECRVNAENVFADFQPSSGVIRHLVIPGGPGVRVDTQLYSGVTIPPFYDSLLAKIIVHAPTRKEAIRKMRVALEGLVIDGVTTNQELLYVMMHNPIFVKGTYDTNFLTRAIQEELNG
ncbi:MAG: acetyl-CoA carboxylase biotin carboxylase subunit [Candidatus Izemoplasmatales bacterium]|nr:acetyl-CoA carboxylase biotin carboxylase subunit [Candidatus Izemoplasmatales bacterium]